VSPAQRGAVDEVVLSAPARFLVGARGDGQVVLRYRPAEPYTVYLELSFHGAHGRLVWEFARDLLAGGMQAVAGHGDVRVWPSTDAVGDGISLAFRDWERRYWGLHVVVPRWAVAQFLRRVYAAVPAGRESRQLDLDAVVAALGGAR
jgi:Streptomyces sporulation and cell division protein, SsgA